MRDDSGVSTGKILAAVICVVVLILLVITCFELWENQDASEIMVVQAPISGELTWYTGQGLNWQGFGKVTKYQKRAQFWFSLVEDQGKKSDDSIEIRFNDGGHAAISGGISWEMPLDKEHLTSLHTKFGSQEAIEQQLVRTMLQKSIYMAGPFMSSTESYASRRNELLSLIEDQVSNGIRLTKTTKQNQKDPITGADKTVAVVELILDTEGKPRRAEESPLKEFGIKTYNLSINKIPYEGKVEEQIQKQQQAIMQVQIAIAEAQKAEQQALTAKKEGEANYAKAEWAQKTIAAQQTTEATMKKTVAETEAAQKLAVAELDAKTAEQRKRENTLLGEGEAARRTLVMQADGALEKKLEAWVTVNKIYAEQIGNYKGNWVPTVVMGGASGGATSNGAADLISMFTAKTAKDLALDMSVPARTATATASK